MVTLKRIANKALSVLLCVLIVMLSVMPASAAITYPDGVTEQTAQQSASKTDVLIKNALYQTEKKTLSELAMPMIISNDTLSSLLTGIYTSMEEQKDSLSKIGIDISPQTVSKCLINYPEIQSRLAGASSWASVNLEGATWGVSDKNGFATAVSAMFGPFNNLLYMLLCSGDYSMGIITIKGDNGYQNSIMGMLSALGCTEILSDEQFKSQAQSNTYSMMKNIVLSIFSMLEAIFASPAIRLSQTMPNLAYYINNGGFSAAVEELIEPVKIKLINIIPILDGSSLLSFLQDSDEYTSAFSEDPAESINSMLSSSGIQLADIDLEKLASCGTVQDGTVTANIGEAYTVIFMWLIDTMKLNKEKLTQELSSFGTNTADMSKMLDGMLAKSTDEIFALLVELLTAQSAETVDYQWQTPAFTQTSVSYTANLGQEKYQRVLDGIDALIDEFVVEYSDEKSLSSVLKKEIYSPEVLGNIVISIYSAVDTDETAQMLSLLDMDFSTYAVASSLSESRYSSVKSTLYKTSSWKNVKAENLNWGFKKGDRDGFEKALTASLRPLQKILRVLLIADKIEIFDAIGIYGSNGYNTAVIPMLEAFGCPSDKIKTYDEFKASADGDKIVQNLTEPLFDLIDEIIEKPIYKLTEILPNIIFFVQNGSAVQCIINLIQPMLDLLQKFGISSDSIGFNLDEIKNTDILGKLSEQMTEMSSDIKLTKPDFTQLGGIGQLVSATSKATYGGAPAQTVYVKADQTGVLITLLRYFIGVMKDPENSSLLDNMMASSSEEGTDDMFAQYSSGIGEQMASMTTDETIEWLYKLLFRERAVSQTVTQEEYIPTIIYEPKNNTAQKVVAIFAVIILTAAALLLALYKKKIIQYIINRDFNKPSQFSSAESQEV